MKKDGKLYITIKQIYPQVPHCFKNKGTEQNIPLPNQLQREIRQ